MKARRYTAPSSLLILRILTILSSSLLPLPHNLHWVPRARTVNILDCHAAESEEHGATSITVKEGNMAVDGVFPLRQDMQGM